jgi:hypothetical protein
LEGRCYRSRRRGGISDGIVDLIPYKRIVGLVGEGRIQERLDTVEVQVEVVGGDRRNEFQEIVSEGAMACP